MIYVPAYRYQYNFAPGLGDDCDAEHFTLDGLAIFDDDHHI
jgi:hypothetical protein